MAITLKKLAVQCEKIAIASGKITPMSSPTVSLYDISREWRALCDATKFASATLPEWSEQEEEAAAIIVATSVYLQRIGCRNIEDLIRAKIDADRKKACKPQ